MTFSLEAVDHGEWASRHSFLILMKGLCYFDPQLWGQGLPKKKCCLQRDTQKTAHSCLPPTRPALWGSPSPLADLSWITVTSQRGPGHLQQPQHLIKPSLPRPSPTPPSRETVPIGKVADGFLILFPFPSLRWGRSGEGTEQQRASERAGIYRAGNSQAIC